MKTSCQAVCRFDPEVVLLKLLWIAVLIFLAVQVIRLIKGVKEQASTQKFYRRGGRERDISREAKIMEERWLDEEDENKS